MAMANGFSLKIIKRFFILICLIILLIILMFLFNFNKDYENVCEFLVSQNGYPNFIDEKDIVYVINKKDIYIFNGSEFKNEYDKIKNQFSYSLHITKKDSFFNSIENSNILNYKFCFWTNSCRDINGSVITDCTVIYIERVFGRRIITFKTKLFP